MRRRLKDVPAIDFVGILRSEIRINLAPLINGRHNAEFDNLVAHFAEVLIALFEFSLFGRSSGGLFVADSVLIDNSLHGHHNVLEMAVVNIRAGRPTERFATHSGCYHLDREISGALE